MGYPIYKLLRAVNRQYPNNGFINYVDVREDTYNDEMIDEDLRDLINETIQEVYKDVAIDEVYSFPTVPGQNQYVLPEDCDLRDIQEVTRTFSGVRGPLPPPPMPGPGPTPGPVEFNSEVLFMINKSVGSFPGGEDMISEGTTYSTIKGVVNYGDTISFLPYPTLVSDYNLIGWADSTVEGTDIWSNEYVLAKPIVENTIFIAAVSNIDPETIWEDIDDPATEPYNPDQEEWDSGFNFSDDNVDPGLIWEDVSEQEGWDEGFNFVNADNGNIDPTPIWEEPSDPETPPIE